jgi:hypothetical protein
MFEKYDGIRAFWNPLQRAFFSRGGKKFDLPSWIITSMPNIFLDGELWYTMWKSHKSHSNHEIFPKVWKRKLSRSHESGSQNESSTH